MFGGGACVTARSSLEQRFEAGRQLTAPGYVKVGSLGLAQETSSTEMKEVSRSPSTVNSGKYVAVSASLESVASCETYVNFSVSKSYCGVASPPPATHSYEGRHEHITDHVMKCDVLLFSNTDIQ